MGHKSTTRALHLVSLVTLLATACRGGEPPVGHPQLGDAAVDGAMPGTPLPGPSPDAARDATGGGDLAPGQLEAGAPPDGGTPGPRDGGADLVPFEPDTPDRGPVQQIGCPAEEASARVLFDIPRPGDVSDDFYRLPFPNDIRRKDGKLQLGDFFRPLVFIPGFDVVDRVVRAIEAEKLGFGASPTVTFRLSRPASFDAMTGQAPAGAVELVDLTWGTPEYGHTVPHRLATMTPGRYLCPRHLMVLRESQAPLLPGHTYAVVLTDALTDGDGQAFAPDTDFAVMLRKTAPSGAERAAAWHAYAPLRRWLTERKGSGAAAREVIAAAVFTVDEIDQPAARLRAAVRATAAPVVQDLVRCGPGVASVCDDARTTGCAAAAADAPFVEYQGRIEIPVFQQGTPPFEYTGGGIQYGEGGVPVVARRELVCFSLTVPKGASPERGWPLVVYGHGTGGHFRWPVTSGLAAELAQGEVDSGPAIPMATLGFDGVLHGSRKGNSSRSTDELVYNVFNPTAARDNNLQAAADLFAVARALPQLATADRKLDLATVGLYGHSQGGNAAAIAAGYEPTFGAVVLSGTGGGIATTLLEKQKPVSAATVLPLMVGENVTTAAHPALAMMQLYFDRADPLNHGRRIAALPLSGLAPKHLLHVFGADDGYAPMSTQLAFAAGAELPVLNPVVPMSMLGTLPIVSGPVRMNFTAAAGQITALEAQYRPDGYDGHFVSTHNPSARAAVRRFLGTFFRDGTPVVE